MKHCSLSLHLGYSAKWLCILWCWGNFTNKSWKKLQIKTSIFDFVVTIAKFMQTMSAPSCNRMMITSVQGEEGEWFLYI